MMNTMSSIADRLQKLADELTEVSPPPPRPMGMNFIVPDSGRWVVVKVGSGMYAIRPEYDDTRGQKVIVTHNGEVRGFAPAIETALKFAISIGASSRHHWSVVTFPA